MQTRKLSPTSCLICIGTVSLFSFPIVKDQQHVFITVRNKLNVPYLFTQALKAACVKN